MQLITYSAYASCKCPVDMYNQDKRHFYTQVLLLAFFVFGCVTIIQNVSCRKGVSDHLIRYVRDKQLYVSYVPDTNIGFLKYACTTYPI